MSDTYDSKAEELKSAFEPKFKEIGAEEVFRHLFLRNPEKLVEAVEAYAGDEEELKRWMRSFVAVEQVLSDKYGVASYWRRHDLSDLL